ncbi:hypothetical protein E3O19_02115 [Cryobacterium algoritolerans]|uniref:DUF222 domain-containing protein n=1 Tax=Cryobacterium algoritolerans TaxID=1259184 RepID=A0A4R8WZL3_9MICO|nr:hypothetical protein [Cryobacterium algoritolerans]TFC19775.1 hypothetical protein E3O19_02115 [Cryobacterium algoritolerans]
MAAGTLSVDAAESIRKSLGDIDTAVTADKLFTALTRLLAGSSLWNADECFKQARRMREDVDEAGIAAREKQAYDDPRSTEQITADSFVQLLKIAGEVEPGKMLGGRRPAVRVIVTHKDLTNANTRASDASARARAGDSPSPSPSPSPSASAGAGARAGNAADSPAGTSPSTPAETAASSPPVGHGYLEGSPAPISLATIERQLRDTARGILFNDTGQALDVGREQRLFTEKQRTTMGARDGGCLWPDCDRLRPTATDCDRPPSWTKAHHLKKWLLEHGLTDQADGICLCHPHHLLLHNTHWEILRNANTYRFTPPATLDPEQTLIPLPSKTHLKLGQDKAVGEKQTD